MTISKNENILVELEELEALTKINEEFMIFARELKVGGDTITLIYIIKSPVTNLNWSYFIKSACFSRKEKKLVLLISTACLIHFSYF